jgi:hypothetical protein
MVSLSALLAAQAEDWPVDVKMAEFVLDPVEKAGAPAHEHPI